MSQLVSLGVRTPAAAASAAYAVIRTASTDQAFIREIGVSCSAATASSIAVIRAATTGTPSTSGLGQNRDPNAPAATVNIDTAWSVAPTVSTNPHLRRVVLPATIGQGLIWTFGYGEGLIVPVSGGIILWNFGGSAGSALDIYLVWEE